MNSVSDILCKATVNNQMQSRSFRPLLCYFKQWPWCLCFNHAENHLPRLDLKRKEHLFHTSVFSSFLVLYPSLAHTAVIIDCGLYTSVAAVVDWRSQRGCDHGDLWPRCCGSSVGWNRLVVARWIYTGHAAYENKGVFFMWALILLHSHTPSLSCTHICMKYIRAVRKTCLKDKRADLCFLSG